MYSIYRTKDFERSYQRCERSGQLNVRAKRELEKVIAAIAAGNKVSPNRRDHQLKGNLAPYRECHIKGDLLLVYQLQKQVLVLVLVDMGTHSYLNL
jgi:mRNA interferase YafQ